MAISITHQAASARRWSCSARSSRPSSCASSRARTGRRRLRQRVATAATTGRSTKKPASDPRLTAWEIVHHLIRVLASGGEVTAAGLVAKLGAKAEIARELAYRLTPCASARSARPRRSPTMASCRAGPRSLVSPVRAGHRRQRAPAICSARNRNPTVITHRARVAYAPEESF